MNKVERIPPTELDLHAFLDDELSPEERIRVIEWLLEHPEKSRELMELQLREDLLRNAVHYSVNGELPEELYKIVEDRSRITHFSLSREFLAGTIVGLIIALITGAVILLFFQ